MDLDKCINRRRSIRKFKDKPVDPDDVLKLIDAAKKAPSAGNLQSWKFIVIKKQSTINKIADACFQQNWISEAPLIIVVVANIEEIKRMYGVRGEMLYSIQNCAFAAENLILKAVDLGLDTTIVSAFEEGMMKRLLKIPDNFRPQIIITVGYGDEEPPRKTIHTLESVTYFENFKGRVEDWDEAFYEWSGIMKKHVTNTLKKLRKGSLNIKNKIINKFNSND